MLAGVRVLELGDERGWLAGRMLADLGADVALVEPPGGHPGRVTLPDAFAALNAGKRSIVGDVASLVAEADVVLETGVGDRYETLAQPGTIWCALTPFGRTGPKASWRASDLAVQAQSGVMYMTGDPDRAPVRCTAPTSWYHGCADAVAAILLALRERAHTGRGALVDVSLQEAHLMATMSRVGAWSLRPQRGSRAGALMRVGATVQREIWRCKDGFVSFGLRGGPARIPGLKRLVAWMAEEGMATPADRDWDAYNHNLLDQDEVDAISTPIARFFETKTMRELFDAALVRGMMLAPANTAHEILASRQLDARGFFVAPDDAGPARITVPAWFVSCDAVPGVRAPAPRPGQHDAFAGPRITMPPMSPVAALKVLEFGAGAAGPLATRYLADHGATVVRVESGVRPDFLRVYGLTATQRSLDASPMFAAFNCNKRAITLNMKHPEARAIALRLVEWADVVAENFAPGAMARWGLSYDDLIARKPDLVMISTCLNGQTGPERDYPGFGGQGSAISGFNHLTGWPDREPLGPYGTITDSLSPRFAAVAILAALHHRDRTGRGSRLDLSQVECAVYCLAQTLVETQTTGRAPGRLGNRARDAAPHGAFRCAGEDRWIAIAVWDDDEWRALCEMLSWPSDPRFATVQGRLTHVDELEKELETRTVAWDRDELAERLRDAGVEAVAVADLEDLNRDEQLAHRGHFHPLPHPVIGTQHYETLGFRIAGLPPAMTRPGPTLGRDNEEVYRGILGMDDDEYERLRAAGVFE